MSAKNANHSLNSKNYFNEDNLTLNVSAAAINKTNEDMSFLHVFPVLIQSDRNQLVTSIYFDSRSGTPFVDQSIQEMLKTLGTDDPLNTAVNHGTNNMKTKFLYNSED